MDIVLVHGYNVTSTRTYGLLPQRLKNLGHTIKDVYLSKYVTLDDDLTLDDIVKAFQAALADVYGPQLGKKKFACVTHSTGGLVARGWIETYYAGRMRDLPISHLIMLAPPNNGSRLASLGKSRLSRLRSLWGVEPGVRVLDGLELGSDFQWKLNSIWMDQALHSAPRFFPVVITGQWIDRKHWDVIVPATYERGSDVVVRAASANLNMQRFSFDPGRKVKRASIDGVPYLVTPQTSHSDERYGVMGGVPARGDHPVLSAVVHVLGVEDRKGYNALLADFAKRTEDLQRQDKFYDGSHLNRYFQVVFRVLDNMGNRLHDYAIELIDASGRGDQLPSGFFADQHKNEADPEFFVFYLNFDRISEVKGGKLGFRVQSVAHSPLVRYEDVVFEGALSQIGNFVRPNQTTLVEVVLKRRLNKNVFRLTKDLSVQKIKGVAGDDWID